MYKDQEFVDDDVNKTSTLIKKALNDNKIFEKSNIDISEFDATNDNDEYDENLKDVYKKHYVTVQYIFKDDTIKTIKNKVCCGIKNNIKFGKDMYLLPSRQYMWSEYVYKDKIEKIMLGQKWIRRTELLYIDVDPLSNIHVYEELRGQLKLLRDNLKRGNKIKWENDENDILVDYGGYFMNNEIYMVDIYNEFGQNYNPDAENLKNIMDVYMQLYFKKIKSDDIKHILECLSGNSIVEENKIKTIYETLNNDLLMENTIMSVVEGARNSELYKHLFKENYITQSVIHVNLRLIKGKIDLFRIFNDFIPSDKYPFVQYQTQDGQIIFKFKETEINNYLKSKENVDVMSKWFENAPYGISFKIKIIERGVERFTAINLNDSGRVEYKTQWKEDDNATIDDIKKTYVYIKELLQEINKDRERLSVEFPDDSEFKYAFINTIQKFVLPENGAINHNDLSEFSRFFYPYVALVIEPRKRQAKIHKSDEKSKFGTYLRYKRVSKYENPARIEQRIMYFMRNYEYNDASLANEISKQFNITEERAIEEIEKVRTKYSNLKRSRKILKKLENIPKYKPPGIGIDIQGKLKDKYKIRVSGARDKQQLDRIINFMNILIYLYTETYILKKPERQELKEKLKKLTNIAKRRNKVDEIANFSKEINTVKQMAQLDKQRIGFKPDKGQNQWTRDCQNSGDDKKRRPQQYSNTNMDELIKKGYKYNKKTDTYEKQVTIKGRHGKETITLKTLKLKDIDDEGNLLDNEIYYACSPNDNGEHMYVGFLTRSSNPHGHCMPCCFKKDPIGSKNSEKRDFFKRCLSQGTSKINESDNDINNIKNDTNNDGKVLGEKLYILQDTNKIQEGRFGFLPKYLDFYFNGMLNKDKKIKHHYLVKTSSGYFFKYGSKQDELQFLNAIGSIYNLSSTDIKKRMIDVLANDKNDMIFTSLNNGDIKTQFVNREAYSDYIQYNNYLDYNIIHSLLSIPGTLSKSNKGVNIVIFIKKIHVVKRVLEKEITKEDFYINCQDYENLYSITNPLYETIFLLKENKNYYPIVMVVKDDEASKSMDLIKTFYYTEKLDNVVQHILDFFKKNCFGTFLDDIIHKNTPLTAKETSYKLSILKKDYHAKYQIIDIRNKCKNIICNNGSIIPVRSSGSIYDLHILKNTDKFINTFNLTIENLNNIYNDSNKEILVKPIGVFYDNNDVKENEFNVIAIMTQTHDSVAIIPEIITKKQLDNMKLLYENRPLYEKIDKDIQKGKDTKTIDKRILSVSKDKYLNESYELFRLEFSEFINKNENSNIKKKIMAYMADIDLAYDIKINKIRLVIYKLVNKDLLPTFIKIFGSLDNNEKQLIGGKINKIAYISENQPNTTKYQITNDRYICENLNKDKCSTNIHCHWSHSGCLISLTTEMTIEFINKISNELATNDLKAMEIMRIGNYFVSDIVDYSRFTEREGQKIVRSSSNSIKKVLFDIFGKDNIPKIGKRRIIKATDPNYQDTNDNNQIRDLRSMFIQNIIQNNLSIFRAYVNGYYWLKHPFYDTESRNLGFYSALQTDLANYFKSIVIDWLIDVKNRDVIEKNVIKYMNVKNKTKNIISDFVTRLSGDTHTLTNCIIELFVINKIQLIPIFVYNNENDVVYIFDDGLVYNKYIDGKYPDKYLNVKNIDAINMQFSFISGGSTPDEINVIYYKSKKSK